MGQSIPLVIGIHGYNTNGEYITKLRRPFRKAGFEYFPYVYGKRCLTPLGNLIANRFRTKDIVAGIVNMVRSQDRPVILVGHSHGAYLAWLVHKECDNVAGVVLLNAALQADTAFNCWVINCYVTTDWVLKIGARLRPFSKWGDYGARANVGAINEGLSGLGVRGHSDVFNMSGILRGIAKSAWHKHHQP